MICWNALNNCPICWALPNLDLPSRRIVFQGGRFSEAREIIFAQKQRNEMSEGKRRCHMPNRVLRLMDLKLLEELPCSIQQLTKLRLIFLNNMSGNLIEKLIHENRDKDISQKH